MTEAIDRDALRCLVEHKQGRRRMAGLAEPRVVDCPAGGVPATGYAAFSERRDRFAAAIARAGGRVRLGKRTTNLFRPRPKEDVVYVDASELTHVLFVDAEAGLADIEGMATYETIVAETLHHGCMPAVVPELKSITVGGAIAGLGVEATSFRYGLVHETVDEMEIVLPDGRVLVARPDNEHADLFSAFPNSFGSLGYCVRARVRCIPVKPYVRIWRRRFSEPEGLIGELIRLTREGTQDFLEGVLFARDEGYLCCGEFADAAPYVSDYTLENIFYRSIPRRMEDYLTVSDFIWRWDTDWFWCSKIFGVENALVRRLFGRRRLNSVTYMRLLQLHRRFPVKDWFDRLRGHTSEPLIHDIPFPEDTAAEFCRWYLDNIPLLPLWLCPIHAPPADRYWPLFPLRPGKVHVNFGFWGAAPASPRAPWSRNIALKGSVLRLGGLPSLYSYSLLTATEAEQLYDFRSFQTVLCNNNIDNPHFMMRMPHVAAASTEDPVP
jgi:FAD/FMN-containing dehydrogenase